MSKLIDLKVTPKKVFLDFGEVKLKILNETYDELDLKIGEDYDIQELRLEDKVYELYNEAIKKLSKTIYSVYQVRTALENKHLIDSKFIDKIINKLLDNHYLDDELFAKLYAEELNKEFYGKYHIINELRKKGVSSSIIDNIDFDYDNETLKAQTYFKLISNKYASNNYAKQRRKINNELLKHGFDIDIINKILKEIPLVESKEIEKLHKDYEKIKNKLGIYSGLTELNEGKIVSALIKMGYSYSDINDLIMEEKAND